MRHIVTFVTCLTCRLKRLAPPSNQTTQKLVFLNTTKPVMPDAAPATPHLCSVPGAYCKQWSSLRQRSMSLDKHGLPAALEILGAVQLPTAQTHCTSKTRSYCHCACSTPSLMSARSLAARRTAAAASAQSGRRSVASCTDVSTVGSADIPIRVQCCQVHEVHQLAAMMVHSVRCSDGQHC
jgi:hypothetical protein